jgi:hypothetical protein
MRRIVQFLLLPISMLFHGLIWVALRVRNLRLKCSRTPAASLG